MSDIKKTKTAFVASEELTTKIKDLQDKMHADNPGEVIAMGLSLLEMSLGREVEFKDKHTILKTKKFANLNQTIIIEDDETE